MRKVMKTGVALAIATVLFAGSGCGGSGDCTSMCKEAQAKNCTDIKGDCAAFCKALDGVASPSGCGEKKKAYLDCLSSAAHPCDGNCGSQENSLESCVGVYCLTHASDANCQTLIKSF